MLQNSYQVSVSRPTITLYLVDHIQVQPPSLLPPTNQQTNRPTDQPTNEPTNQPTNQLTNLPTNQLTNQQANTKKVHTHEYTKQITLTAEHVRPALVVPTPVVRTDLGLSLAAKRRNWLLPHPGSPVIGGGAHKRKGGPGGGTGGWWAASTQRTPIDEAS